MTQKQSYSGLLVLCLAFAGYVLVKTQPAHVAREEEEADSRRPAMAQAGPQANPAEVAAIVTAPATIKEDPVEKKIKILEEVFASRNDNDPRLDTEFKDLSMEDRQGLEKLYNSQAKEKLNERGTVVFLLGRQIDNPEALNFLKSVAAETPCADLSNCSRLSPGDRDDHEGIDQITLAYPQIVALKAVNKFLTSNPEDIQMRRMAEEIVLDAVKSKNDLVSQTAQQILTANQSSKL